MPTRLDHGDNCHNELVLCDFASVASMGSLVGKLGISLLSIGPPLRHSIHLLVPCHPLMGRDSPDSSAIASGVQAVADLHRGGRKTLARSRGIGPYPVDRCRGVDQKCDPDPSPGAAPKGREPCSWRTPPRRRLFVGTQAEASAGHPPGACQAHAAPTLPEVSLEPSVRTVPRRPMPPRYKGHSFASRPRPGQESCGLCPTAGPPSPP